MTFLLSVGFCVLSSRKVESLEDKWVHISKTALLSVHFDNEIKYTHPHILVAQCWARKSQIAVAEIESKTVRPESVIVSLIYMIVRLDLFLR